MSPDTPVDGEFSEPGVDRETTRSAVESVLAGRVTQAEGTLSALRDPVPGRPGPDHEWCALAEGFIHLERGDPAQAASCLEDGLRAEGLAAPARAVVLGLRATALVRSGELVEGLTTLRSVTTPEQVEQPSLDLAVALAFIFDEVDAPQSSLEILDRALEAEDLPVAWGELTIGTAHIVGSLDLRQADLLLSTGRADEAKSRLDRVEPATPREQAMSAIVRAGLAIGSGDRAEGRAILEEARARTAVHGITELHRVASLAVADLQEPGETNEVFEAIDGERCFGRTRRRYHQVGRDRSKAIGDHQSAYLHQRALLDLELGHRRFTQALSGGFGLFTSEAIADHQRRRLADKLDQAELKVGERRDLLRSLTSALSGQVDRLDSVIRDPTDQGPKMVEEVLDRIDELLGDGDGPWPAGT